VTRKPADLQMAELSGRSDTLPTMSRRMRSPRYRAGQWEHRYAPHVEPINRLVDELGELDDAGHPPYVAPMYRGIHAPAVAILRDPGPKAGGVAGSGFLSIENDDQTAERQCAFFTESGIEPANVVPWNAYPWYINARPTKTQLAAGTRPLHQLLDLLPALRVVLLLGGDAQAAWQLFLSGNRANISRRGIEALSTYHPSRQALQHPSASERDRREQHIRSTLAHAAQVIAEGP
jgi:hypothetical protein